MITTYISIKRFMTRKIPIMNKIYLYLKTIQKGGKIYGFKNSPTRSIRLWCYTRILYLIHGSIHKPQWPYCALNTVKGAKRKLKREGCEGRIGCMYASTGLWESDDLFSRMDLLLLNRVETRSQHWVMNIGTRHSIWYKKG